MEIDQDLPTKAFGFRAGRFFLLQKPDRRGGLYDRRWFIRYPLLLNTTNSKHVFRSALPYGQASVLQLSPCVDIKLYRLQDTDEKPKQRAEELDRSQVLFRY